MEALGSDSAFFHATILIGAIMTAAERFWRYLMPDPQVESLDDYERRMFGMLNKELAEQSVHQSSSPLNSTGCMQLGSRFQPKLSRGTRHTYGGGWIIATDSGPPRTG
jgi:hypothetical protein